MQAIHRPPARRLREAHLAERLATWRWARRRPPCRLYARIVPQIELYRLRLHVWPRPRGLGPERLTHLRDGLMRAARLCRLLLPRLRGANCCRWNSIRPTLDQMQKGHPAEMPYWAEALHRGKAPHCAEAPHQAEAMHCGEASHRGQVPHCVEASHQAEAPHSALASHSTQTHWMQTPH